MKYVISGGIGTAITLFGMSYLYGITGSTNIVDMQKVLTGELASGIQLLLALAFLLLLVGLSFKIATVPFHMWAPDVYEGAATPVTAFLGTISKIAGFLLIIRLFLMIFASVLIQGDMQSLYGHMSIYIAVLASITMIVGNVVALKQYNIKRLFAYSGIAHAGYLLVPLVALSPFTMDSMWFYMLAYMLMNIGAFAIIHGLILQNDEENITIFTGLYKRSPFTAIMMTILFYRWLGYQERLDSLERLISFRRTSCRASTLRTSFDYDGYDSCFIRILFPYFTTNVFPHRRDRRENTVTVKYKGCYESLCNFDCNTRDYADDWVQFLL